MSITDYKGTLKHDEVFLNFGTAHMHTISFIVIQEKKYNANESKENTNNDKCKPSQIPL